MLYQKLYSQQKNMLALTIFISLFTMCLTQFDSPCKCEQSYCECCVSAFVTDLEACLRLRLKGNRVRISLVINEQELGGFSFRLGALQSQGFTIRIPCLPGASASIRFRNNRNSANKRSFCVNVIARTMRAKVFDNDYCFDVNGDALINLSNNA